MTVTLYFHGAAGTVTGIAEAILAQQLLGADQDELRALLESLDGV